MNKYAAQARRLKRARYQERSCATKKRFASREEAFQVGQAIYACKFCGGWHRSGTVFQFAAELRKRRKA